LALLPEHVHLTLVDDAHPDNPARKRAAELGCDRRLRVVGRVSTEELVNLYRRATVVAVPSRYEGFGLPVAEAMACGTPVVATDAGALREVLETAGSGVMVSKDDPASLAKGIATQLEQPRTRGESARRARDRIVAAYAWPRIAEATAGVYADVVQEFRDSPD
jgi:glycosyltransferase involved in cell wall biosynthesis